MIPPVSRLPPPPHAAAAAVFGGLYDGLFHSHSPFTFAIHHSRQRSHFVSDIAITIAFIAVTAIVLDIIGSA